jgi:dihydroceramidase
MSVIINYKSSINWCERDYIHNSYIAEFWNTISGIALIYSSYYFHKKFKHLEKSSDKCLSFIMDANNMLFIVGIGTILFHATLLYFFQLFDEIPMLLIAYKYIDVCRYILYNKCQSKKIYNVKIIIIFIIVFSYFISPLYQITSFMLSLTFCVLYLLYLMIKINNKINNIKYADELLNYSIIYHKLYTLRIFKIKKYNKVGIYIFIFSMLIWAIDSLFCSYVEYIYLHAIWHILTSIGVFYLNNIFIEILYCNQIL